MQYAPRDEAEAVYAAPTEESAQRSSGNGNGSGSGDMTFSATTGTTADKNSKYAQLDSDAALPDISTLIEAEAAVKASYLDISVLIEAEAANTSSTEAKAGEGSDTAKQTPTATPSPKQTPAPTSGTSGAKPAATPTAAVERRVVYYIA
jgi:hypothetical protein